MHRFIYIPPIAGYEYIDYLAVLVKEREKIVGSGSCERVRTESYELLTSWYQIKGKSKTGEKGSINTESDVENKERKGVSDIWRTRSAEM